MEDKNCLIIAGEKSGEEHAASFLDDIINNCEGLSLWGVGGELLSEKKVSLMYHLKDFSSWGISEVIFKIPFYKKALNKIVEETVRRKTKVAILIDFQSFNLTLAKRLKKRGIKVLYYVAPQAWAWKPWRAKALEEAVHTLFTILPFEKDWFTSRGVKRVCSVNHPLYLTYKESLESGLPSRVFESMADNVNLLILPGSRNFEVKELLPEFILTLKKIRKEKKINAILVKSPNVKSDLYDPYLKEFNEILPDVELIEALKRTHMCLAASGTVTLACALFEVPTVVSYKTSLLNEYIFYTFVKYSGFISLANIVHQKELFPEILQEQVDETNLAKHLLRWMNDKQNYDTLKEKLKETKKLLRHDNSNPGIYMSQVIEEAYS